MTILEFLTARLDEEEQRASDSTFCSLVWPSTDRILADIAAKRRIIEICQWTGDDVTGDPERILAELACVYADHPDYREEWRP